MLVLSRKLGEEILIGKDIRVMVTQINGGVVRIGLVAPNSVQILRPEAKAREPKERKVQHVR